MPSQHMQVLCARVQMHTAKELTNSTYRLCAVRTASAFRTISDDAALVIPGQVPLCELVREPQNQDRGEEECQDAERRQLAGSLGQLQQGGYHCARQYLAVIPRNHGPYSCCLYLF
ncbi:uncharacterized protein LOC119559156 [Drosophila subpulchrella]|uniref:uncharacterized protein LOC119559156 n=1 Tax=Drosophila subpulchrella TaxID=1486046 RepID=UPI0018A15F9A|nr:uncharacterized protein LOC119559156 [Drosophila subpulchrella]